MTETHVSLAHELEGARVRLRAPHPGDLFELKSLLERNALHLRPWSPSPPPGGDPLGLASIARAIVRQRREWCEALAYPYLVVQRADGALIGRVTLSSILRTPPLRTAQVGYWIDAAHERRGFISESLSLVLEFAFGPLRLHKLQAAVMPSNTASRRVLAKHGFREEGYAPRHLRIAGRWEDHLLYATTSDEWAARRAGLAPRSASDGVHPG